MSEPFTTQFSTLLDGLLDRQRQERRRSAEDEARWTRSVKEFRSVVAQTIRPVLEQVQEPLRARGLRSLIGDNTRFGMSCWLEIEGGDEPAGGLAFRLDADRGVVEAVLQRVTGTSGLRECGLAEVDADWVQETLLAFLHEVYGR